MMKIKDKEHQFLGFKELEELVLEFPNDASLGKYIRQLYWDALIRKKNTGLLDQRFDPQTDWIDATPT